MGVGAAGSPRTLEWRGEIRDVDRWSQPLSGLSPLKPALRLTSPGYLTPPARGEDNQIPPASVSEPPAEHLGETPHPAGIRPARSPGIFWLARPPAVHLVEPTCLNPRFRGNSHIRRLSLGEKRLFLKISGKSGIPVASKGCVVCAEITPTLQCGSHYSGCGRERRQEF